MYTCTCRSTCTCTCTVRVKKNFPYPFRLTGGPFKKQGNERTLNGNRKEDERMENGWHPFRCTMTYPFFRACTVYLNGFLAKSHVRAYSKSVTSWRCSYTAALPLTVHPKDLLQRSTVLLPWLVSFFTPKATAHLADDETTVQELLGRWSRHQRAS